MTGIRRVLLHRRWLAAVLLVSLGAFIPRVNRAMGRTATITRSAGLYSWEAAPPSDEGDAEFRWTRGRAALRERIQGRQLVLPIFLTRPDIAAQPISLRITVGGAAMPAITLTRNGWHIRTFDLAAILGEGQWRSQPTVTLDLRVTPTVIPARLGLSSDPRELGVGVGAVRWKGAAPR